jgi:threonine/homoserine/homoserine lactone efflux protein
MQSLLPVLSIAGAVVIGAMSPGPSFVLVLRTAIAVSRRAGLAAALGMGVGGLIFGTLALFGLQAVIAQVGWLYLALKVAGGLYLLYLAVKIWRGAREPLAIDPSDHPAGTTFNRAFLVGLGTQLSNPKTAVAYGSIFAALLPANPAPWTFAILLPLIFLIEAGWYTVVALTCSSAGPRAVYLRSKQWVDRTASTVIGALGIKLLIESVQSR